MKAGSFNIHDYLGKLYENVNEEDLPKINEEKAETETGKPDEGILQQGGENKAYNWLKKEFQKGKTEVKVEMSSHTFKPGYHLQDAPKSTKDFPGMYGQVKTSDMKGEAPKAETVPFPETKFPGGETSGEEGGKKEKNESSEGEEKKEKKSTGITVEAKTKKKVEESSEDLEEGNEFSGARAKAKKEGKKSFKVGGKTYPVK